MKTVIFIALFAVSSVFVSAQETDSAPKNIAAGVVNSKAKNLSKPEYPSAAAAAKVSGKVEVLVTIDERGDVISAKAISGPLLLRETSEKAALQSEFTPTYLSGKAVKVTGTIIYNFTPEPLPDEKEVVWVLGMMLSFLQSVDANFIAEIGSADELKDILAQAARDVPAEIAAEKPLFDKLAKTEGEERRLTAVELNRAMKKYFKGAELWQYEVGENLGLITIEMVKHVKNARSDNKKLLDETILRTSLQRIKDLLLSAPPDVSAGLQARFKSIGAFADSKDLTSMTTLEQLYEAIDPLFSAFSDAK